jgi:hypothetical protein
MLSAVDFPVELDFSLESKSFNNLTLKKNQKFDMVISLYTNYPKTAESLGVEWHVYAPTTDFRILDLPEHIKQTYPMLSIDKLEHRDSNFALTESSYTDFIEYTFKGKASPTTFTRYHVSVGDHYN